MTTNNPAENNSNLEQFSFEDLRPTVIDSKGMEAYKKALDFAFNSKDITNIAITGPYASGKSSVLYTYELLYKEKAKKIVNVSLAYFTPTANSGNFTQSQVADSDKEQPKNLSKEDELLLERKILNQLIHQVDPAKIPATEFKIKKDTNKKSLALWSTVIALITAIFFHLKSDLYVNISKDYPPYALLLFASTILLLGVCVYQIIKVQSYRGLVKKLKIFDNEFDIAASNQHDVSYFDKYIDEILYILRKSDIDAIAFEDIDRYDDNHILNKLRELSFVYNKKFLKKIKFIFLIKDEIFHSKDRTKFFDFIIPIVPILSTSNACNLLNKLFSKEETKNDFDDSIFLHELSLYIDDYRLLKNIYNEYLIYKQTIKPEKYSWMRLDKLLAIIIYKNIFPYDFSQTQLGLGRGVVHRIIASVSYVHKKLIENRAKEIDITINEFNDKIELARNEFLKNLDELDCLYFPFQKINGINLKFDSHQQYVPRSSMENNLELIRLLKQHDFKFSSTDHYNRISNTDLGEDYKLLKTREDYTKRKEHLETNNNVLINGISEKIIHINQEKIELMRRKNISELFDIYDALKKPDEDDFFKIHICNYPKESSEGCKAASVEFEEIQKSPYYPLLKYLLREGYIDENNSDYMGFFYEGDKGVLHANDVAFLRGITDRNKQPFDLRLNNCELLLDSRIKDSYFNERYILNFSLLDYLLDQTLNNHDRSLGALEKYIKMISALEENEFIEEYISRCIHFSGTNTDMQQGSANTELDRAHAIKLILYLIDKLNSFSPLFWQLLEDSQTFLYLAFITSGKDTISKMNHEGELTSHIDRSIGFLEIDDALKKSVLSTPERLEAIGCALTLLEVQIVNMGMPCKELLECVYKNDLYSLTLENIDYMLTHMHSVEGFENHRIQAIYELSEEESLHRRLLLNLDEFLQELLESETEYFDDSEDVIIKILNNEEASVELRAQYIQRIRNGIEELNSINDKSLRSTLLQARKVSYTPENIIEYFISNVMIKAEEEEPDNSAIHKETLIEFINNDGKEIPINGACPEDCVITDI